MSREYTINITTTHNVFRAHASKKDKREVGEIRTHDPSFVCHMFIATTKPRVDCLLLLKAFGCPVFVLWLDVAPALLSKRKRQGAW